MKKLFLISILISLELNVVACTNNSTDITSRTNYIAITEQSSLDTLRKPNGTIATTKKDIEIEGEKDRTSALNKILENPEIAPGKFVVVGEWIYFIKPLDNENNTTAIYKINIFTQRSILVCKDNPYNIFTDGNWIYYNTLADGTANSEDIVSDQMDIYKIKADGTDKTLLLKGSWIENVDKDWIYYSKAEKSQNEENSYLFRVKTNGLNVTKLGKDFLYTQFIDKYIYYINYYQIGRINIDGSNPRVICKESQLAKGTYFQKFLVEGNVLYFSTSDSHETKNKHEGIFQVNVDGTNLKNVLYANTHDADFAVYKDRILYVSVDLPKENPDKIPDLYTYTLNEFNIKNKKCKKLFQIYDGSLNLLGDWLYYPEAYGKTARLFLNK